MVRKYFECAEHIGQVPFLDQVTLLECDSKGCIYTNVDHDITLRIPEGAIPDGMKVQFEVAVTLYGPFKFCNSRRPISPILWLCPQEDVSFQKPIEIVLPHILTNMTHEDISHFGIKFSKAVHGDYTNQKQYTFHSCDAEAKFVNGFGVLKTNHCCFLCISAIQSKELTHELAQKMGYCITCVECLGLPSSRDTIYMCASYLLKSCLKVYGYLLTCMVQFNLNLGWSLTR